MTTLADSAKTRVHELIWALGLFTRVPLPAVEAPSEAALAGSIWAFPLAGFVVGAAGAIGYAGAVLIGLPALLAALVALAATVAITGAMHEDGLGDFFDGIGGGGSRAQKLEIMRDSRIGSYGVMALVMSAAARWAGIAALTDAIAVAVGLVAVHVASRSCLIPLFYFLAPARDDGLSAEAGRPQPAPAIVGLIVATLLIFLALPAFAALKCFLAAAACAMVIALIAKRHLGGHTGDVFGAAEQAAEIGFLWALVVTV